MTKSLKELFKQLNSPRASYREGVKYETAFPYRLPLSIHLIPNQSIADSLTECNTTELLEIKHGTEVVQVANFRDQEPRISYKGKTATMKETTRLLNPEWKKGSLGDHIFEKFARELKRTQIENSHFEDSCPKEFNALLYSLRRLIEVYEIQDSLIRALENIARIKSL